MKRISFNVKDNVYETLKEKLNTENTTVSGAFKEFAYSLAKEPLEVSAEEKRRLEAIEYQEKKLAEKKESIKEREPKNPFLSEGDVNIVGAKKQAKPDKNNPFVK